METFRKADALAVLYVISSPDVFKRKHYFNGFRG